jgi:uncharacterized protein (DUF305 family)
MSIRILVLTGLLCVTGVPALAQDGHGAHGTAPAAPAATSDATRAYVEAMDRMHGPMMDAAGEPDPDVAFMKGMIPHHQAAIDMAKIVQQYGDDAESKALAARIIAAQEAEIAEMEDWLRRNGH